jgi:tetratricopeptide (TPR) repeat protein
VKNFEEGVQYFKIGKFEEALVIANSCIQEYPNNPEIISFRARVLSRLGKLDDSLEDFNHLVKLEPYNTNFISDRAVVLHLLKMNQEALSEFDRAINLDPANPYRYSSRAFLKDRIGDFEGAIQDYEKAIELDPEDAVAYNNKGLVEEKLGYKDQSNKSFINADSLVGYTKGNEAENRGEEANIGNSNKYQTAVDNETNKPKVSAKSFYNTLKAVFLDQSTRNEFVSFIFSGFKKR